MNLLLKKSTIKNNCQIFITGSKSETNRLLLLQALYPNITLENISNSDDSDVMTEALRLASINSSNSHLATNTQIIDVHHAGTAMRFLAAFFAIQDGKEVVLTGSSRMKDRPIKILVEALNQLGAEITYLEKEGFPPIKIDGKKLLQSEVSLDANVSSQYISALLLIAPKLKNGLKITLNGEITSVPYIKMTLALLRNIGVEVAFKKNIIVVKPAIKIQNFKTEIINGKVDNLQTKTNILKIATHNKQDTTSNQKPTKLIVESDWSSASYWFSVIALSEIGTQITLSSYKQSSLQGDAALVEIYKNFGVKTVFNTNETIAISKVNDNIKQQSTNDANQLSINLNNCPDIAQTIVVTCFGLGIACDLYGLQTLKIKETDRLEALKTELSKLGAAILVTNDSLHLEPNSNINTKISIKTYQDHRMAMAFAPLAIKTSLIIENAEVVSKSYPTFWEDLKSVGFEFSEFN